MQNKPRMILSLDSLGALAVGMLTGIAAPWLEILHGWTPVFIGFMAAANLAYGLYSGALYLLIRKRGTVPAGLVVILIAANFFWALQCGFQAWRLWAEATWLGIAHLILEGTYVGFLAWIEMKIFFLTRKTL